MDKNQMESPKRHHALHSAVVALVFIAAGILILGRNLGFLDPALVSYLVSWQMLLVIVGAVNLVKRNYVVGFVVMALGFYFMLPDQYGIREFWPLWLVLLGVALLFRLRNKDERWPFRHRHEWRGGEQSQVFRYDPKEGTTEGFVASDVTFSSAKHVVLDAVFKGADLDVTFGSLVLDLRRTQLVDPVTVIQIDATFSGVELYIPASWNIIIEADTTLSGFNDKRFLSQPVDTEHKLIIRGDITFSGVDIKS